MTARAEKGPPKLLAADLLYEMAEARWTFARTPAGVIAIEVGNHWPVALNLKDDVRPRLAAMFRRDHGRVPDGGPIDNAMRAIVGSLPDVGVPERNPQPRVARDEAGRVVVDLDDGTGRACVVDAKGAKVEMCRRSTRVCFARSAAMGALPEPDLSQPPDAIYGLLASLLNMDDTGLRLVVGWLVAALMSDIAHPILILRGEQGTAKSTAGRYLARIIDDGPAPLRAPPANVDAWFEAATASWVVTLDNVSSFRDEVSDALCRAVTGDGQVKRKLFTDGEAFVVSFRRAIIVTTIETSLRRGDLAERSLPIELSPIGDRRVGERELEAAFAELHPQILGSLLNMTSRVLAELPDVRLAHAPRMADFAAVLAAVDRVMGWDGTTLQAYMDSLRAAEEDVLEASPFAEQLLAYLDEHGPWQGAAGELLKALEARFSDESRPAGWPKNARGISGALKRINPALRGQGWEYEPLQRLKSKRVISVHRWPREEPLADAAEGLR